jgi:hypothetical protein
MGRSEEPPRGTNAVFALLNKVGVVRKQGEDEALEKIGPG